jgi:hypothetical protein
MRRQIVYHCRSSAYNRPMTNTPIGNHTAANSEKGPFTHGHCAAQMHAGGNVNVRANAGMVIDRHACIDDDILFEH